MRLRKLNPTSRNTNESKPNKAVSAKMKQRKKRFEK